MKKLTSACLALGALVLNGITTAGAQPVTSVSWKKDKDNSIWIIPSRQAEWPRRQVRLQWYSAAVVRVSVLPVPGGNTDSSMCVTALPDATVAYTAKEANDSLYISTSRLSLAVSLQTGLVAFSGSNNLPLLRENGEVTRFAAAQADGQACYAVSNQFTGSDDDAWYGLGQHQDDLFNYRNRQVQFFQNNTAVAVPFVLSRKQYGILWDNNSISTAGDIRSYQPLSHLRLFAGNGEEGWLTQTFANNKNKPSQLLLSRAASDINIAWLGDSKIAFPADFTPEKGVVRYKGAIAAATGGIHRFQFTYAGYVKMWLNGKLVLDRWRQAWNPGAGVVEAALEKDKKNTLEIEWLPDGSESYLTCHWMPPIAPDRDNRFGFASEAGHAIDYYFITGENMDSVIGGYRFLTGKAVMMPRWAFGFWQSRERYKTQAELLNVVQTFRDKKIPIDNIVQDWSYWKEADWGSQEFDSSRFPSPDAMIQTLHNKYHTQLMISVWPKFYTGIPDYDIFRKCGWLYGRNVADSQRDWIASGYVSTFYDAFNANARKGFWQLLKNKLYSKQIDAWWMDASEPDILSNVSPQKRITQMTPTALGPAALWLNAYPLANARGIYDGQRSTGDNRRVFLLTRSGFAGSQRYAAAIWSGDIASRWYDMKAQITAGLNFSMSGLPYWTMDAGGFSVEKRFEHPNKEDEAEWRELQTRWYQFGAFTPLFRVHGQYPFREIYNIAPETHPAYQSMLYYIKLRYHLLPYIYSLAGSAYHNNYTLMRALVMDFPKDTAVTGIGDQYMFGPSLLVNPVYEYGARNRSLYLPAGAGWYQCYTGAFEQGGRYITADAPYERMPLYARAGAIIPAGPEVQYAAERKADTIRLYVYAGANGSFNLYEDNGLNYDYEKGSFSTIPVTWDDAAHTITVGSRQGSFEGMPESRTIQVVYITPQRPKALAAATIPDITFTYKGKNIQKTVK